MSPNDPTYSASEPYAHHAATVCLSVSEINALCFKAARGAGLHWGEAEEAGWAAAWLSRAGLAGPSLILAWLSDAATLACPAPAPGHWRAQGQPHCPLRTGVAVADFAGLPEGPGTQPLTIAAVAHPIITLPFVARAATKLELAFRVGWADGEITVDAAQDWPVTVLPGHDAHAPVDLQITAVARPDLVQRQTGCAVRVPTIAFDHWQALDALALHITVPPSLQSRAGAGAAGGDND